jgi:hypothetical protein
MTNKEHAMASRAPAPAKSGAAKKKNGADEEKTRVQQQGESAPRLPHERDQSSDSQQDQGGAAPRVGRQALDDIERGVVDTDRGPVADRVYNDKLKP